MDEVAAWVDRARNNFRCEKAVITDHQEYRELIGRFYAHVQAEVLGMTSLYESNPEFFQGFGMGLLKDAYAGAGWITIFNMARTGLEGGLRAVLDVLSERMALEYAGSQIATRVADYLEGLSHEEKVASVEEYLNKFGHLLPTELIEDGPLLLSIRFYDLLKEHPFLIRRLRRLGR